MVDRDGKLYSFYHIGLHKLVLELSNVIKLASDNYEHC